MFVLLPSIKLFLLEKLTKISVNAPAHGKHIVMVGLRIRYLDEITEHKTLSLDMRMENRQWYHWRHPEQTRPWVTCFVTSRRRCSLSGLLSKVFSSNKQEWMSAMIQKTQEKREFRNANLNRSICYTQTRWASQQERSPLCEQRSEFEIQKNLKVQFWLLNPSWQNSFIFLWLRFIILCKKQGMKTETAINIPNHDTLWQRANRS